MGSVYTVTGATERIEALVLSGSLVPLTGKTDILLSVRRVSDGFWLDFTGLTFKSSGWTTRRVAMTETDATNDPGVYHYNLATGSITNPAADDVYECRVDQSPGTDAANLPQTGELRVGKWVDGVEMVEQFVKGKWEIVSNQIIYYNESDVEIMRFDLKDSGGNPTMVDVYKREPV